MIYSLNIISLTRSKNKSMKDSANLRFSTTPCPFLETGKFIEPSLLKRNLCLNHLMQPPDKFHFVLDTHHIHKTLRD